MRWHRTKVSAFLPPTETESTLVAPDFVGSGERAACRWWNGARGDAWSVQCSLGSQATHRAGVSITCFNTIVYGCSLPLRSGVGLPGLITRPQKDAIVVQSAHKVHVHVAETASRARELACKLALRDAAALGPVAAHADGRQAASGLWKLQTRCVDDRAMICRGHDGS